MFTWANNAVIVMVRRVRRARRECAVNLSTSTKVSGKMANTMALEKRLRSRVTSTTASGRTALRKERAPYSTHLGCNTRASGKAISAFLAEV